MTQFLVIDQQKTISLMMITKQFSQLDGDDVYRISRVQKIKLTSRVFAIDTLRENNGKLLVRANGGLDKLTSRLLEPSARERLSRCHKILAEGIPFFAGVSPIIRLNPGGTKGRRGMTKNPSRWMITKCSSRLSCCSTGTSRSHSKPKSQMRLAANATRLANCWPNWGTSSTL